MYRKIINNNRKIMAKVSDSVASECSLVAKRQMTKERNNFRADFCEKLKIVHSLYIDI